MYKSEKQILREHEDKSYQFMRRCARAFGRESTEFQTARAEWMAYHNMCYMFDVEEVVQDVVQ